MSKEIKVSVWMTQRVTYRQTITMPVEEFKRLDALQDDDPDEVAEELLDWLDLMDVDGGDDVDLVDFRPANGEPDPRDEPEEEDDDPRTDTEDGKAACR